MSAVEPLVRIACLAAEDGPAAIDAGRLLLGEYRDHARTAAGPGFGMARLEQEIAGLPESHLGPDRRLLIAWLDDRPAGCVVCKTLPEVLPERAFELKRLWVRAPFRSRGIAERLVAAVVTKARDAGGAAVYLDTEPARMPAAMRLYRRLGFTGCPLYRPSDDGVQAFRLPLG